MNNIKPIAMNCNQEQFDAIKIKLEKLGGIDISKITRFLTMPILTNNLDGEIDSHSLYFSRNPYHYD